MPVWLTNSKILVDLPGAMTTANKNKTDSGTASQPGALSIAEARIASIKAGLIGAAAIGITAMITTWILAITDLPIASLHTPLAWFVNLAVAISSGFFFGVTYRYIVRQDDNLHLSSGAVGAFGMVRSLAIIETLWQDEFALLLWLLVAGESFLWFAMARYALDFAISKDWIQPLD